MLRSTPEQDFTSPLRLESADRNGSIRSAFQSTGWRVFLFFFSRGYESERTCIDKITNLCLSQVGDGKFGPAPRLLSMLSRGFSELYASRRPESHRSQDVFRKMAGQVKLIHNEREQDSGGERGYIMLEQYTSVMAPSKIKTLSLVRGLGSLIKKPLGFLPSQGVIKSRTRPSQAARSASVD